MSTMITFIIPVLSLNSDLIYTMDSIFTQKSNYPAEILLIEYDNEITLSDLFVNYPFVKKYSYKELRSDMIGQYFFVLHPGSVLSPFFFKYLDIFLTYFKNTDVFYFNNKNFHSPLYCPQYAEFKLSEYFFPVLMFRNIISIYRTEYYASGFSDMAKKLIEPFHIYTLGIQNSMLASNIVHIPTEVCHLKTVTPKLEDLLKELKDLFLFIKEKNLLVQYLDIFLSMSFRLFREILEKQPRYAQKVYKKAFDESLYSDIQKYKPIFVTISRREIEEYLFSK